MTSKLWRLLGNCKQSEYEDCKRLLMHQKDELIEKIYYDLMFDDNGEENSFIPTGCNYEQLLAILKALGGQEEVFSEKLERKARKIINHYQAIIAKENEIIDRNEKIIEKQKQNTITHDDSISRNRNEIIEKSKKRNVEERQILAELQTKKQSIKKLSLNKQMALPLADISQKPLFNSLFYGTPFGAELIIINIKYRSGQQENLLLEKTLERSNVITKLTNLLQKAA